jgi:hypothetical protein
MSSEIEPKLLAFLAGQFALAGHQTCTKVELEYTPRQGFRPDPIQTWTPQSHPEFFGQFTPGDGEDESDVAKLAEKRHVFTQRLVGEIIELATNFADSYDSGTHRFTVRTHRHLGGRSTFGMALRPAFRGESDGETESLEPTNSGVVGQLMRHLENKERGLREMMGTFLQTMRHAVDTIREENESLRTQVASSHEWRQKTMDAIEEARSKEHDRELELAIVMGEKERKEFMVKKVANLLPVAASIAARKLGAGKDDGKSSAKKAPPTPLAVTLGKLAMSITDEQKSGLQSALGMDQVIALQTIIEDALDGGSLVLVTLVHDLVGTLKPSQVQALMGMFTQEQATYFVQAIQLAKASTQTQEGDEAGPHGQAEA